MSAARDDVQEFAASLTRIKERTDRSYGQLARRLNMNTSTLHRYCAGDTVPLDFAPVERFAALCGATGEERLELHRLWLLAVAARQRTRTPGGGSGDAGSGSSTPTESAQSAEPVLPVQPAGSADPCESVEPAGPVEPAGATEPADPAGATEPADPAGATEPAVAAEPGPSSAREPSLSTSTRPDVLSAPPPPRRPWNRRRRTLVGAAVAAVLIAILGTLAALPSGRPPADSAAQGGDPAPSRTTAGAQRPSNAPTSPSPSPDTTKSPSGTPSPTRTKPRSTPTKNDDTEERRSPATGVPLTWTANSQLWKLGCGHDYVIAKPPTKVPPPPTPQDAGAWAATQQAVHGRNTIVEITVQGRKSAAVVLTALRVRVVGRTAPAEGNAYAMDQGCGGRVSPRYFDVDLDKNRPIARPVDGADLDTPLPAVRFPYSVSAEDSEVLTVSAQTETCDCLWYLELEWSSEGRTGTVRIDDNGRPFRTTGIKGLPRYTYATEQHQWVPLTD
ncbi:helix-turn-helix domain-containing protein [Streptomyces europaeiscabiei]|uniref:helix-turn-helix domain-containing protein n=1 Tax=Streptomyces europaeiscabiei TaxID=146819 RepID=UPI0038F777A2